MRKYKAFIASSDELKLERKEIALMISRKNNAWVEKDIYIEPVLWEELLHSFTGAEGGIQDHFTKEMLKCDMVIVLFYRKVGMFTREEFDTAYRNLKRGKKPRYLFVYFKSGQIDIEDITPEILEIGKLKKEIQKYKELYGSFNSLEDLTLKLQHQLDLVIEQKQLAGEAGESEADKEKTARLDLADYKQHMARRFRNLDFTGLNAILQKPLQLENIYVTLRATETNDRLRKKRRREKHDNVFLGDDIDDFYDIMQSIKKGKKIKKGEDFVSLFTRLHGEAETNRAPLKMGILGKPGSGKTTLMKWIALQCLHTDAAEFFSAFIPIYISLKDLGADPQNTFRTKNIGAVARLLTERENAPIDSFYETAFKENRLLFLLDGLDEIADEKTRSDVITWIGKQYTGRNPLVVTSRFSGLNEARGIVFPPDVKVFRVLDFSMEDVAAFLKNWYRGIEAAVAGESDGGTRKKAEENADDLIKVIEQEDRKSLRELAVNPLLLTIIAVVHRTRATLPRDRHKLYEECLKVMIELWNMANRKVDVAFSFENSAAHLSCIAVKLMDDGSREMDRQTIEACLPPEIEEQPRAFFLKEMVLKAGLLYESEGHFGFLHLTFQEYLAARHFAHSGDQNAILAHRGKDYWKETFRLFVNTGNARVFFDEIGDRLLQKEYWRQMRLWSDCLREVVVENTRRSSELRLAEQVADILVKLEYKEENTPLIDALAGFYPFYMKVHGEALTVKGLELFNNARHPFVQSLGTSILFKARAETQETLMARLRERIDGFDNQPEVTERHNYSFFLQNINSFMLLLVGRQKITDFNFALAKLKSEKIILQCLELLDLRYLLDLRDLRYLRDLRDLLDLLDLLDLRELLDLLDLLDLRDRLDLRYLRDILTFKESQYQTFTPKYESKFRDHRRKIIEKTDTAIKKLRGLTDKEILKYFPNTTADEIKNFRESYTDGEVK